MFLLYVDESGSSGASEQKHFVLGGVCLFERQVYHLSKNLDKVVESVVGPEFPDWELHASRIHGGGGSWRKLKLTRDQRRAVILDGLRARADGDWRLFGIVVDKSAVSPRDPVEYAFEQLCSRFDRYLLRLQRGRAAREERGLIIFDKSVQESQFQSLATRFRTDGHTWGRLTRQADVPLFVDSRATRAIQYADLVAYALWRKYEKGDSLFFDEIKGDFDRDERAIHGLHHRKDARERCDCPACRPG